MSDSVQLTSDDLRKLLQNMVATHGKAAAVKWLQEEWLRQPEALFDAFIGKMADAALTGPASPSPEGKP